MQECIKFWGEHNLRTEPLRIRVVENAIYMPSSKHVHVDRDLHWGIYTEAGELIPEAAYERFPGRELVGQSRSLDLTGIEITDGPVEEMVYAGPIVNHYGHFILASLSRLWAIDGARPALFHSYPPIFDHGARFVIEIVAAAGLTRENTFSFDRPTRIRRLFVPEPSLVEQLYTTQAYSISSAKIGASIMETGLFVEKDYYISKSRMRSGVACLANEEVIEAAFQAVGFDIIYPETLPLADQVSLFRNARTIVGTVSSAFHTAALVPGGTGRHIMFDYTEAPNANFRLLEIGMRADVSYYSISSHVNLKESDSFLSHYVANDIKFLAEEMVRIAKPSITPRGLKKSAWIIRVLDKIKSKNLQRSDGQ
ncbi:hypothetical protein AFFFEF_04158 [Methylorubrum extorquens]